MSARSLPAVAACTLVTLLGSTLDAQNPVATALQAFAGRAARNLIAAAEEMPADKYGFKPTPAQMSVGQVVIHLANGNDKMCGWVAGSDAPAAPQLTPADSKDKLVARLKQSFDFCTTALIHTNDANLADSVPFFGGRKLTRAAAMMVLVDDWADHYSQLAIYLRLNGLLPPTAKRGES